MVQICLDTKTFLEREWHIVAVLDPVGVCEVYKVTNNVFPLNHTESSLSLPLYACQEIVGQVQMFQVWQQREASRCDGWYFPAAEGEISHVGVGRFPRLQVGLLIINNNGRWRDN